jgi:Holliday junction resolvase RusA-like endonuclease
MKYEINITPMGKPRMVKSDAWKKRPCVVRYWAFKDDLNYLCDKAGYRLEKSMYATFHFQMPKSWPKKTKLEKMGTPHDQRSDLDNCVKAICDCLLPSGDEKVWLIGVNKIWAERPGIVFYDTMPEWMEDL